MNAHLILENICKSYDGQVVLDNLNLTVQEGEFFFLLGPSGCGKTTLLRILSGLLEPDSGSVRLLGRDITRTPAHKRDANTVFQNYALFPHMNVFNNVAFGLRMKKVSESAIKDKVTEALRLVSLPDFAERMPHQMSGGQMQRVALARAIVNEPAILLLDEPLGALDVKLRKQMQLELRQLQRKLGTTFICVTHDQDEALTLGDRIAVMNSGRFEQVSDAHTLYNSPVSHFVCDFLGDCNFMPGNVLGSDGATLMVETPDVKIRASEATSPRNKQITLGVRPEKIALESSDPTRSNVLKVKVIECIFTGNHYRLRCRSASGSVLDVMITNDGASRLPKAEELVQLSWRPEDTIILDESVLFTTNGTTTSPTGEYP